MPIHQYDHPNYTVRREHSVTMPATLSSALRFASFQKMRLKGVHASMSVAGTSTGAAGNKIEIQIGTTSVGVLDMGTVASGVSSSVTFTTSLAALTEVKLVKGTDATAVANCVIEYEVLPDATQS